MVTSVIPVQVKFGVEGVWRCMQTTWVSRQSIVMSLRLRRQVVGSLRTAAMSLHVCGHDTAIDTDTEPDMFSNNSRAACSRAYGDCSSVSLIWCTCAKTRCHRDATRLHACPCRRGVDLDLSSTPFRTARVLRDTTPHTRASRAEQAADRHHHHTDQCTPRQGELAKAAAAPRLRPRAHGHAQRHHGATISDQHTQEHQDELLAVLRCYPPPRLCPCHTYRPAHRPTHAIESTCSRDRGGPTRH